MLNSCHFQAGYVSTLWLDGYQLTTVEGSVTNQDFDNAVDVQQFICYQQLQTTYIIAGVVLNNNNFSGEGIHVLAAFMYVCSSVGHLFCESCGITSNDLKKLLDLISELRLEFSCLEYWFLQDNNIDDDGVSALIQHLSMFPELGLFGITLDGNIQVSPGMLRTLESDNKDSPLSDVVSIVWLTAPFQ